MSPGYESFFGLVERPFSLTPDTRYFFKSRSHGRAIETLTFSVRRREQFMLVTGDVGIGKTTLCRTLAEHLRRRSPVCLVRSPLLTRGGLFRLLLEDFGAIHGDEAERIRLDGATPERLYELLTAFLTGHSFRGQPSILIVDEAHAMPSVLVQQLLVLADLEHEGEKALQVVLAGQSAPSETAVLQMGALEGRIGTRVRLQPLGRDECGEYVAHRLAVGGASATAGFSDRAVETLYSLTSGVPRMVNLVCERALQEAAALGSRKVEATMIEAAASDLELIRARPRRFRWFSRRVS